MITRRLLLLAPTPLLAHSINHINLLIGHAYALPAKTITRVMFPIGLKTGEDELLGVETSRAIAINLYKGDEKLSFPLKFSSIKPIAMQPNGIYIHLSLAQEIHKGDKFKIQAQFKLHGLIEIEVWVEDKPYG